MEEEQDESNLIILKGEGDDYFLINIYYDFSIKFLI